MKITKNVWQRIIGMAIREQVRSSDRVIRGLKKRNARPSEIAMTRADYQRERDTLSQLHQANAILVHVNDAPPFSDLVIDELHELLSMDDLDQLQQRLP